MSSEWGCCQNWTSEGGGQGRVATEKARNHKSTAKSTRTGGILLVYYRSVNSELNTGQRAKTLSDRCFVFFPRKMESTVTVVAKNNIYTVCLFTWRF